ncbi:MULTISPECIES: cell division inhibitor MinD [Salinibaculum]|uniref:nucleotide-binding protein n=1 Tax=Salinibaculum TaxID=2732368 RepID=UPI0030D2A178
MFALTGGKGGSGKTTAALGLARALAADGADPLVVDADVGLPDAHLLAGVDRDPTWDQVARGEPVTRVYQRSAELGGIAVLPAGTRDLLGPALEAASDWHGPVLVDCPAGAGPGTATPLRHAEGAVLATTAAPAALSDAEKTARVAERLDAPVLAALVRDTRETTALPFECPHVERVPAIDLAESGEPALRTVLDDPRVRAAHQSVAASLLDPEGTASTRRRRSADSRRKSRSAGGTKNR